MEAQSLPIHRFTISNSTLFFYSKLFFYPGLNSQGQKLDAVKADKVAESQSDTNAIGNLSPDDLKSLLANHLASQKEKVPKNAAQTKLAEGLNQVPGAAASAPKKPAAGNFSSTICRQNLLLKYRYSPLP